MRIDTGTQNEQNRNDWIIRRLGEISAGARLLDAGAGEQPYKRYCDHLVYISQDFAKYDGKGDNTGLQMNEWSHENTDIVCDITEIPEPDGSFDAILCSEVFEHIPEPIKAIIEFGRLMKKGGTLLLTAPFCSLSHFAPYHFYSGFNRYFYMEELPKAGFKIVEMTENGNYFEYLAQELRRLPSVADKYSDLKTGYIQKKSINQLLKFLNKASENDKASKELLCYGLHIKAIKQ